MAVKIRLQRKGKKKQPFYHIVIADARSPRDGRFIEKIGTYNPLTSPATIDIDRDKAYDWLSKGAQPTETVRAILRFKGVLYRTHVMRGVAKGAHTEEAAMQKYQDYIAAKDAKTASRAEKTRQEKIARHAKIAGLGIERAVPEKVVPKVEVQEPAPPPVEPTEPIEPIEPTETTETTDTTDTTETAAE